MPERIKTEKSKETRIAAENKRLRAIFLELPPDLIKIYDGLILRAAYMRIALEDYEQDLNENGYVEMFTQSEKLGQYERERPVARLYSTMNKNYQSIMKQLADKLPDVAPVDGSADIMQFILDGKK
jgi:hypothetical protein